MPSQLLNRRSETTKVVSDSGMSLVSSYLQLPLLTCDDNGNNNKNRPQRVKQTQPLTYILS